MFLQHKLSSFMWAQVPQPQHRAHLSLARKDRPVTGGLPVHSPTTMPHYRGEASLTHDAQPSKHQAAADTETQERETFRKKGETNF